MRFFAETGKHAAQETRSVGRIGGGYSVAEQCAVLLEMARHSKARTMLFRHNVAPNSAYERVSWTLRGVCPFGKTSSIGLIISGTDAPQRREFFRWKKRFSSSASRNAQTWLAARLKLTLANLVDLSSFPADHANSGGRILARCSTNYPQPYDGRCICPQPGTSHALLVEADYGWSALAKGGVDISIVQGGHEKKSWKAVRSIVGKD